jgi:hypothetical protein
MAKKPAGVFIPQEAWDWLMGLGDTFKPGPDALKIRGKYAPYWWRSELRRRISKAKAGATGVRTEGSRKAVRTPPLRRSSTTGAR